MLSFVNNNKSSKSHQCAVLLSFIFVLFRLFSFGHHHLTIHAALHKSASCSINECEDFKAIPHNRIRRVPRKADEIAVDEVIEDPLQNYKIKTYFIAFDTAIPQIKERFNEISSGLFKDLSLFS